MKSKYGFLLILSAIALLVIGIGIEKYTESLLVKNAELLFSSKAQGTFYTGTNQTENLRGLFEVLMAFSFTSFVVGLVILLVNGLEKIQSLLKNRNIA